MVFTEAIKRDIVKHSDPNKNQYVLDYYEARSERGEPGIPQYPLHTYPDSEVIRNSLREFTMGSQGHRDARQTNLAEYSVAILYLVAHSTALFPWTRELLRRHKSKDDEDILRLKNPTFETLFFIWEISRSLLPIR